MKLTNIMNDNDFEITISERQDEIVWEIELEKFYGGLPILVIVRNDDSLMSIVQKCIETLLEEKQIVYADLKNFEA